MALYLKRDAPEGVMIVGVAHVAVLAVATASVMVGVQRPGRPDQRFALVRDQHHTLAPGVVMVLGRIIGTTAELGFHAPRSVPIWRDELWREIQQGKTRPANGKPRPPDQQHRDQSQSNKVA